ncbi:selenophosphate synthase [Desulfoscipio geothermicus DSM 3669]|uniref:Selenide, water dikinase n=2 Tax=Desulfoscipio geothermicus TaxID=39060 RepID=A0A1I6D3K1_9FIRM|nr:selenophosphate synthase [Desulfoscipio geothermicus DSM 3669]
MVGLDTSDDAAVYKLNDRQALIQTVDFFTPMVDDPYLFGQIAAANALSDIYAMGGQPLMALNIVCFPDCLPIAVLQEILQGGADKVVEAEGIIAGGHTVRDDEPKYGLAVTGLAHPAGIITNATARPGDRLVLTKPLGTGIINTGIKAELVSVEAANLAVQSMAALNKAASLVMMQCGANACTDITGFGLLGHAAEMAAASKVSLEIAFSSIPMLPETLDMARMGLIPAGAYDNKGHLEENIRFVNGFKPEEQMALFDPQTSGGLLISMPEAVVSRFMAELNRQNVQAAVIGKVSPPGEKLIRIV